MSSLSTYFVRGALASLLFAHTAFALAQAGTQVPAARPAPKAPADMPLPAPAAAAAAADSGAVRVLVVADMDATISSQLAGRLATMPKQVGDTFAAGELLATFDCQDRKAAVQSAEAELMGARETHVAKLKLQSLGAVSDLDVTLAAATAEKAKSQLQLAQVQEKHCVVQAPYAGKVVRVRAKAFESVALGQPLLEIVNLATLRAQAFVPSAWVRWLKPGKKFSVSIDETGQTYQAVVHKISGRIDGASQTVEVLARFERTPGNLLPGMIGKASFPEGK